ncbi:angiopoietin-related protein 4-like isoform X2 [Gadus macrocephalus]|uniref:angiopoietin-related protein 4-like isoform X2 n=1 Tax=Gadus macrocephalus TaxID=80720 RepID=UPI0028CBACB4|nr:angiopoietin-related protein 4-like isoform X2 [Gadus macrocephalus]
MRNAVLFLLPVTLLLNAVSSRPLARKEERGSQIGRGPYASWDDVNVLAHGLLQLGQGLKEHVEKNKAQVREVNVRLRSLNGSLVELASARGVKGAGAGVELELERGEGVVAGLRAQTEELRSERLGLRTRLERVEEKRTLAAQNRRIDDLLEKIRQQQDKLEKQGLHLQALQTKVGQRRAKVHRRSHEDTAPRGVRHSNGQQTASAGLPKDCHEVFTSGQRASGVYTIQPAFSDPFSVLCEMNSDGGWTVIQKRQDGSQSFNQLWESYQKGFGHLNGEFWLGLDRIHSLSNQGRRTLQVQLSDRTGAEQLVNYRFRLDGPENDYALHLAPTNPAGVQAGAMATGASGLPFSTADRDNDLSADVNCAKSLSGGWWFSSCGEGNLNGRYPKRHLNRQRSPRQQMSWATASGSTLTSVVMKIAPFRD